MYWAIIPQISHWRHLSLLVPPGTTKECYEEYVCDTLFISLLNHCVYTTRCEDDGGRHLRTRVIG